MEFLRKKGEVTGKNDRNLAKGFSFQVLIKEKGQFKKAGNPMTRNDALDYGSEIVDKGSSASFKIVRSDKQPVPNQRVSIGYFNQNLPKFRVKRMNKSGGIATSQEFIENETNRLDTEEEKNEISRKGIQKRKVGGFFKR
jgi:hypothetical protein